MQFSVVYLADQAYVLSTLTGDVSERDLKSARGEMNSELLAHGCKRLLVDATGISRMQSVVSDFEFTAQHRTELPPGTRHAVVIKPEQEEHMRFVENVAQNRSVNLRLFTDKNEAVGWLCSD